MPSCVAPLSVASRLQQGATRAQRCICIIRAAVHDELGPERQRCSQAAGCASVLEDPPQRHEPSFQRSMGTAAQLRRNDAQRCTATGHAARAHNQLVVPDNHRHQTRSARTTSLMSARYVCQNLLPDLPDRRRDGSNYSGEQPQQHQSATTRRATRTTRRSICP